MGVGRMAYCIISVFCMGRNTIYGFCDKGSATKKSDSNRSAPTCDSQAFFKSSDSFRHMTFYIICQSNVK